MRRLNALLILPTILSLGLITKDCSNSVLVENLGEVTVYAQQTPVQLHLNWDNPQNSAIVSYSVFVNGVRQTPSLNASTVCPVAVTTCVAPLTLPTYGKYSVYIVAQAYLFDFDLTSLTDSSPSNTVTFSVNPAPSAPSNVKIKN